MSARTRRAHAKPRARAVKPGTAQVDADAAERLTGGHLWVYRNQLTGVEAADGDLVQVLDPRGRSLGSASYSAVSKIALRICSRPSQLDPAQLVRDRVRQALAYRQRSIWRGPRPGAYRLIHAEGDGLPATIVDVYREHCVVQTLTRAAERWFPQLADALEEAIRPASILLRNDPAVRTLEGLAREVVQARGTTPAAIQVSEDNVHFWAHPQAGQKTGLFLDQAGNHVAAGRYTRGEVLDCFCYDGGFTLHAARRSRQVTAVDISAEALGRAQRNAQANGFGDDAITWTAANAFDTLRAFDAEDRRFDTVILDPPAFAKNRGAVDGALRGYKEINLRALKLLRPGGVLITCSCSYHVSDELFGQVLRAAAGDARRTVVVRERRRQAADHPILIGVAETAYLKCWVLEVR